MELIETRIYRISHGGLPIYPFNRSVGFLDFCSLLLASSEVMYDQETDNGRCIFRVLSPDFPEHYVVVPKDMVEEWIEGPLEVLASGESATGN